jgi:ATP-dependent Clp protease ATP-binding subunit ClpX
MNNFLTRLAKFIYWKFFDIRDYIKNGRQFDLYGLRLLTGRQGSGKTIGLVYMLEMYRKKYPKCKIYTNFGYVNQDGIFRDWQQLKDEDFLNGSDGVIVAWDEIQNDFASTDYKNIPEGFLNVITQQRKQRICILATSQVYTRVLKSLREQCFIVAECKTFLKRWTRIKFYDAYVYEAYTDKSDPAQRWRMPKSGKLSFIQNNKIRTLYDTYSVIKSMVDKIYIHPHLRQ